MATSNGSHIDHNGRGKPDNYEGTQNRTTDADQEYYSTFLRLSDAVDNEDTQTIDEPRFSVRELLNHLIHHTEMLAARDLFVLSDLTRQDAELVRQDWGMIPVAQRRQLLQSLTDVAEENVSWHLGRLLRIALEDEDPLVRRIAIDGLWEELNNDLIGPLIQILHNDNTPTVRAAAAATLGAYVLAGELDELDSAYAMRVEEALLAALHNPDEDLDVQCRALESIAYSGETGIRQLIEDAYYSPEEELRVSALVAMGRSADTRWRGLVRAELQNPSPQMRIEAARACGELEVLKAERELLELLSDDEQMVRLAAIFALGRIGSRRAQETLRSLADSDDEIEAEAAELALEEMLFYSSDEDVALFDDADEEDEWDLDQWDTFDDLEDDDFGSYEDD
ncbi:MAG: HEAT repeat domain-containing protein [Caldilineaceae bacterium]|nr:HEAT repeat domain-containing protein [Caldilineaceae bacterium]